MNDWAPTTVTSVRRDVLLFFLIICDKLIISVCVRLLVLLLLGLGGRGYSPEERADGRLGDEIGWIASR